MPGASDAERRSQARLLFSGMAGTMMVARAVSDRELSDTILAQGRKFYIPNYPSFPRLVLTE